MILNSKSRIQIGTFKTVFYSNSTSRIELNLSRAFLTEVASAGNLCSLSLTEYGDMRSFISKTAPSNSFGTSKDMVQFFDCLQGNSTVSPTRQL